jgi:putative flavoprotein involved in K+ transport
VEVAIVGGGPAGLATAGALKQKGLEGTVLEAGAAVGTSWRNHYDRLHLHTVRSLSALPGRPIPRQMGRWVAREDLVRYLEDYAGAMGIEVEAGVEVTRIERSAMGWRVETRAGERDAAAVVMATGYNRSPVLPDWPGQAGFKGALVHSSRYRNPAPYRGKSVLVVGSGNSGAEIAADLVEGGAGRVLISIRTPPNIQRREFLGVPTQVLGILLGGLPPRLIDPVSLLLQRVAIGDLRPYGIDPPARGTFSRIFEDAQIPLIDAGFLDLLKQRRIEVVGAVEGFDRDQVLLRGGRRLAVDAVIAATGFRRALEPLVGHLGVLRDDGQPSVDAGETAPGAPGLYFCGYRNSPGGLLRQIRKDAEEIATAIAEHSRQVRSSAA